MVIETPWRPSMCQAIERQVTAYALLSKGMDPARIDRLAEAVVRLTDPGQVVDDGIRFALRDVTRVGIVAASKATSLELNRPSARFLFTGTSPRERETNDE